MPNDFECLQCGSRFTLPAATLAKFPSWTPKACMDCRPAPGARAGAASAPRKRGMSVTRASNLDTGAILNRFHDGPQSGIFTDGSCQGNPGPGGWGAVHVREGVLLEERFGSDPATTNNRMELTAMIEGLLMVDPSVPVTIHSDSRLVIDTLTKWAKTWEARGWTRKEGEVKNLELVQRAHALLKERPLATLEWIRAHDGSRWNEYADSLSTAYLRETV